MSEDARQQRNVPHRKDQRYVRHSRELRGRLHAVNPDVDALEFIPEFRHLWACPGCGMQNDARHQSCRYCQTLRWGVCP